MLLNLVLLKQFHFWPLVWSNSSLMSTNNLVGVAEGEPITFRYMCICGIRIGWNTWLWFSLLIKDIIPLLIYLDFDFLSSYAAPHALERQNWNGLVTFLYIPWLEWSSTPSNLMSPFGSFFCSSFCAHPSYEPSSDPNFLASWLFLTS